MINITMFFRNNVIKINSSGCKWKIFLFYVSITVFTGFLFSGMTSAQENGEWPCFHGLSRSNKSSETGLLEKWPEKGPELLWTIEDLGKGYSSVSIAHGYLYTAGLKEKQNAVYAYDLNGNLVWEKLNGPSWETTKSWARSYTGSRSTPTYDDGLVFHLSDLGRLTAFHYKTGQVKWSLELLDFFEAEIPEYGYTESVLVEKDRLYCAPAGKKGFVACLDKKNGNLLWANTEIPGAAGNSSHILSDYSGHQMIIGMSASCVYCADRNTGKLFWTVEFENIRSNNITDPIFHNGCVFASTGYGKGSILWKLKVSGNTIIPERVWQTELMDNHHGGIILHDGYVYGSGQNARGWFCLDLMSGKQMWKAPGKGSLTYADNMFYFLEERGTMKLVRATPEKYDEVSSFEVPEGGEGMHWAHPVVCGGRLYVRHADKLFAYKISRE